MPLVVGVVCCLPTHIAACVVYDDDLQSVSDVKRDAPHTYHHADTRTLPQKHTLSNTPVM